MRLDQYSNLKLRCEIVRLRNEFKTLHCDDPQFAITAKRLDDVINEALKRRLNTEVT